jgi:hypothetical protein
MASSFAGAATHDRNGLLTCSLTMYSAYQFGQSSSRWPVRFSCSPCAISARRSSVGELKVVSFASTRPGNRAVISCNSQPLPSGSLNEANER